jgi:hypothetical protein
MDSEMKKPFFVVLGVVLFGLGYAVATLLPLHESSIRPAMEDAALTDLVSELGAIHLLESGRNQELRALLDVNLNNHLTQIRENEGDVIAPEVADARRRTLARVADIWDKEPPFQTQDFEQSKSTPWYPEWKANFERNLALVKAAQVECQRTQCNKAASTTK